MHLPPTNAYRLIDGATDGFPGVQIDDFNGRWLVQTRRLPAALEVPPGLGYRALYQKALVQAERQSPSYLDGERVEEPFIITENGLSFWVDFRSGYSQGVFLDQRDNRNRVRACSAETRVLNTFAYTCTFGVAAAAGGAQTLNLDLSHNYLEWGKRNYRLNRIDPAVHEFVSGDVFNWLKRFSRQGRQFDLIILDPPTFSRNREAGIFRVEQDYPALLQAAQNCLAPNGSLLCCTNSHQIEQDAFAAKLGAVGRWHSTTYPMPADFRGSAYLKTVWLDAR